MTDEKITLDKEVFKTLASGTRVDILKSLDRRRKTLSELSKQLGMSVSTIKEHLDNLVSVDLIVQIDDGHKWKYYELTKKGKDILHPEDKRIWILLGLSAAGIVYTGIDLMKNAFGSGILAAQTSFASQEMIEAQKKFYEDAAASGGALASPEAAPIVANVVPELPYLHIAGFILFGILIAACFFYLNKVKKEIRI